MKHLNRLIQYFQHPLNQLKTKSQISFLILSIITLVFCKDISGYICNYNTDVWYERFVVIERLAMLFLLLSFFTAIQKRYWLLSELLLCFLVQDVIDRLYFDIRTVTTNDYITIGLLSAIAIIKFKNKNNDNITKNKKPDLVE